MTLDPHLLTWLAQHFQRQDDLFGVAVLDDRLLNHPETEKRQNNDSEVTT